MKRNVIVGLAVILVLIAYGLYVALSPPGREITIDEHDHPKPLPVPVSRPIDTFRSKWDSEAYADWPVTEVLATMSEQAYMAPVDAEPAYRKLGFQQFTTIVEGSMAGYVVSGEDVTVIVFRGTNPGEISDWFVNLDALSIDTSQGSIHKGFFNA